ncbi:hypothetical protein SDC9_89692 [bioreactor metagenome]|uniref:Uncharacterized protein n=1 Tax=bioreactor metagenome TaxID=1076179 RepID=A0A644ZPY0_9ZZZZ
MISQITNSLSDLDGNGISDFIDAFIAAGGGTNTFFYRNGIAIGVLDTGLNYVGDMREGFLFSNSASSDVSGVILDGTYYGYDQVGIAWGSLPEADRAKLIAAANLSSVHSDSDFISDFQEFLMGSSISNNGYTQQSDFLVMNGSTPVLAIMEVTDSSGNTKYQIVDCLSNPTVMTALTSGGTYTLPDGSSVIVPSDQWVDYSLVESTVNGTKYSTLYNKNGIVASWNDGGSGSSGGGGGGGTWTPDPGGGNPGGGDSGGGSTGGGGSNPYTPPADGGGSETSSEVKVTNQEDFGRTTWAKYMADALQFQTAKSDESLSVLKSIHSDTGSLESGFAQLNATIKSLEVQPDVKVNVDTDSVVSSVGNLTTITQSGFNSVNSNLLGIESLLNPETVDPLDSGYSGGHGEINTTFVDTSGISSMFADVLSPKPSAVVPRFTFPFSAITLGHMDDIVIDFSSPELASVISILRLFEVGCLVILALWCFIWIIRSLEV